MSTRAESLQTHIQHLYHVTESLGQVAQRLGPEIFAFYGTTAWIAVAIVGTRSAIASSRSPKVAARQVSEWHIVCLTSEHECPVKSGLDFD